MDWETLIKIGHIVGTALGVGGATFAEIFYLKSIRGGEVDQSGAGFLKITYRILRIGMVILIISGFGYLILSRVEGYAERLWSPRLWSKLTIILILLLGVVAWQAKKAPMWLGSAISLSSWYAALILGAWRLRASYFEIMLVYFLAVAVVALVLEFIKRRIVRKAQT